MFFVIAAVLFLIGLLLPPFKEWVGAESPTLYRKLLVIQYDEQTAQKLRQLENDNFLLRCAWFGGASVFFIGGLIKSPRKDTKN
jgi:hypothetical protein